MEKEIRCLASSRNGAKRSVASVFHANRPKCDDVERSDVRETIKLLAGKSAIAFRRYTRRDFHVPLHGRGRPRWCVAIDESRYG